MSTFSKPTATTERNVFRNSPPDIGHCSDCIEGDVAGLVFGQGGPMTSCWKSENFNRDQI
jgi:hypothetical protein